LVFGPSGLSASSAVVARSGLGWGSSIKAATTAAAMPPTTPIRDVVAMASTKEFLAN
jgi:hypothetical protein